MAPKAPNKLRKKLQRKEQEIVEAPHSVASKAPNGNPLCCVPKGQTFDFWCENIIIPQVLCLAQTAKSWTWRTLWRCSAATHPAPLPCSCTATALPSLRTAPAWSSQNMQGVEAGLIARCIQLKTCLGQACKSDWIKWLWSQRGQSDILFWVELIVCQWVSRVSDNSSSWDANASKNVL